MKNKISVLLVRVFGVIALAAIIGFSMVACASDDTDPEVITINTISGVTAPVAGAEPVSQITPTAQFTGRVYWEPSDVKFKAATVYTATIELSEKEGWTTKGIPENFFTVAGATATNDANSYKITAVFPATSLITATFTSINEFSTWLTSQPTNTAATPYLVNLNVASLGGNSLATGSVGKLLSTTTPKYVRLDLSGSTLTSIENQAFAECNSLTGLIIGNTVTSIENQAVMKCENLTSVTIGNAVTSIGSEAFYNCYNLPSITIPASVTTIGNGAFSSCDKLTAINVDNTNTAFASVDGVLYSKDQKTLVAYPAGKTGNEFIIPEGVTSIRSNAFDGNCNLTSITIPKSLNSLTGDYFTNFAKLAAINVAEGHTSYTSESGILYNTAKTTLVRCPPAMMFLNGTLTIPTTVTTIDSYAFRACNISNITIPANVTKIGNWAFNNCTYLTSVKFEGTIASADFGNASTFDGDLRDKYLVASGGGVGTYTRTSNDYVWTKQP